ncbi:MAG: hypothetical protein QOE55_8204, partial [Acidobacteriaceae bacterium]|nr:hypothetical protein [Acidobacteriaceae bacterium]
MAWSQTTFAVHRESPRRSAGRRGSACRFLWLAFAALCVLPPIAFSQSILTCKGPARLEQMLASSPSTGAYDALGSWFATQRQLSCAISAFESALRLDPKSWESHYDLGITLLTSRNPKRAIVELQTASRLKPNSEQILLPLGAALSELNRQDEAIEVFQTILKADPQSVKAIDGLTKALIAERRYTAAIAELKNAPADEVLQLNLAVAYSKNGDTNEALKVLSATVKQHPSYAQGHFNMGAVYVQQNRFGEAAQEFKEALRLDPSDDVACLSYIKALVVLG